ncbi:hypothetical protein R1flu_022061 [Riccia fluitans]|uniref:Uncharacterized protein n=1 Tax=Riccia fluitans TaxID=41844 RepID=A0ABD1ZR71_9MARC
MLGTAPRGGIFRTRYSSPTCAICLVCVQRSRLIPSYGGVATAQLVDSDPSGPDKSFATFPTLPCMLVAKAAFCLLPMPDVTTVLPAADTIQAAASSSQGLSCGGLGPILLRVEGQGETLVHAALEEESKFGESGVLGWFYTQGLRVPRCLANHSPSADFRRGGVVLFWVITVGSGEGASCSFMICFGGVDSKANSTLSVRIVLTSLHHYRCSLHVVEFSLFLNSSPAVRRVRARALSFGWVSCFLDQLAVSALG